MKIYNGFGFHVCGDCGACFQVVTTMYLEDVNEDGEIIFIERIDNDSEASGKLAYEHYEEGCEKRDWSWDDIEYIEWVSEEN
jgi:hypothetical protein